MRRIRLVLAVLAVLVVMVGSAVPAIAQDRDHEVNYYNQGNEYGQVYNDTSCGWYWSWFQGWTEWCWSPFYGWYEVFPY